MIRIGGKKKKRSSVVGGEKKKKVAPREAAEQKAEAVCLAFSRNHLAKKERIQSVVTLIA